MNQQQREALAARLEASSPAPWVAVEVPGEEQFSFSEGYWRVNTLSRPDWHTHIVLPRHLAADAEFIAHARQDIEALLKLTSEQQSRIEELEERLARESRLRREAERSRPPL